MTSGVGFISGPTPAFTAPDLVGTIIFELRVNDGNGDSAPDSVQINVMEHSGEAIFVDGGNGNDDGTGSRDDPYATISGAINRVTGPDQDIYIMSRADGAAYEESQIISPQSTISLYGGYGTEWFRDVVSNRTRVNAPYVRIGAVSTDAWFSGFELTTTSADGPGKDVFGVTAESGTATLYIEDNTITAGNAGSGGTGISPGSSYGIHLANLESVILRRNTISAGDGGIGDTGSKGGGGKAATTNGGNGNGYRGGAGGKGGVSSGNGGKGDDGGRGLFPQDGKAGGGTGGGIGDKVGEGRVGDGGGGGGGAGGNGGGSGAGICGPSNTSLYDPGKGSGGAGTNGGTGAAGGGGGGGAGGVGLDGGGGHGGFGGGGWNRRRGIHRSHAPKRDLCHCRRQYDLRRVRW